MAWNLTWDYSLISHPIHYNFSGKASKTKPFLTTQPWFITKGGVLWAWPRSRWKKSGIVELEQSPVQHHSQQLAGLPARVEFWNQRTALANHHSREPQHTSEDFTDLTCTIFLLPTIPKLLLTPQFSTPFSLWSWLQVSLFSLLYSQYPVQQAQLITPVADCSKKRNCLSIWPIEVESSWTGIIFFCFLNSRNKTYNQISHTFLRAS